MRYRNLLLLFFGLPLAVLAADPSEVLPHQLQLIKDAGYIIVKRFDVGHGLTGWALMRDGRGSVVYSTNDGQLVIAGNVVDAAGQNLTESFVAQYVPRPDLNGIVDALAHSGYIADRPSGTPRRIVYVIFDANCPYCSVAWHVLHTYVPGGLEVRWLPVATVSSSSPNRAAAILTAKDPLAALATNEDNFVPEAHQGGIEPAAVVPEAVVRTLKSNEEIMTRLSSTTTPTFVWVDDKGATQFNVGLPQPPRLLEIVGNVPPASSSAR